MRCRVRAPPRLRSATVAVRQVRACSPAAGHWPGAPASASAPVAVARRSTARAARRAVVAGSACGAVRTWRAGVRSTNSSSSSMAATARARPGSAGKPAGFSQNARQADSTAVLSASQSMEPRRSRPLSASVAVSMNSTASGGPACGSGRCSTHTCRPMCSGTAAPGGSAITARTAPPRSSAPRTRRPEERAATAGGSSSTARPPGSRCARACCAQASSDSARGGSP